MLTAWRCNVNSKVTNNVYIKRGEKKKKKQIDWYKCIESTNTSFVPQENIMPQIICQGMHVANN